MSKLRDSLVAQYRAEMERRDLTVSKLAEINGVSIGSVHNFLNMGRKGYRDSVKLGTAEKWADYIGCEIEIRLVPKRQRLRRR